MHDVLRVAPAPDDIIKQCLQDLDALSTGTRRFDALVNLATAAPANVRPDVVTVLLREALALTEGWPRDAARGAAARRLAGAGLVAEARLVAESVADPGARRYALAALAPQIAETGAVDEALAAIQAATEAASHEETLLLESVVVRLVGADRVPEACEVLDRITDQQIRQALLVELAPALAAAQRGILALEGMRAMEDLDEQVEMVVRLASPLAQCVGVEALYAWVGDVLPPAAGMRARIAVVREASSTEQARGMLQAALDAARRIGDAVLQRRAIAALALQAQAAGDPRAAWRMTARIDDPGARLATRIDLVTARTASVSDAAVADILEDAALAPLRSSDRQWLTRLATRLSGEDLDLALRVADAIDDPATRCRTMLAVANGTSLAGDEVEPEPDRDMHELPPAIRPLRCAVELAVEIGDEIVRDSVLVDTALALLRVGARDEALTAVQSVGKPDSHAYVVVRTVVDDFLRLGDVDAAWRAASSIRTEQFGGSLLARVAVALPPKHRASALRETLAAVPGLREDDVPTVLRELAPALREHGMGSLALRAAEAVQSDPGTRAAALIEALRARPVGEPAEQELALLGSLLGRVTPQRPKLSSAGWPRLRELRPPLRSSRPTRLQATISSQPQRRRPVRIGRR
jgi:hypothetical protein